MPGDEKDEKKEQGDQVPDREKELEELIEHPGSGKKTPRDFIHERMRELEEEEKKKQKNTPPNAG
jgi:hypothetical protein